MIRTKVILVLIAVLVVFHASPFADIRTDEKVKVEFGGVLGGVVKIFGGKAAREGVTSTVAVKGDRKATLNDTTGQIIDLGEEKVYDLDLKKKSYKVTTFAELRRRMEEARKKAEEDARKAEPSEKNTKEAAPASKEKAPEMQIDFDVKNTGAKKTINGFDTHQVTMTITAHEKGKTLDQSGGLVTTTDMWLAPGAPSQKEVADFDRRYAEKLYGSMVAGVSAEQMAAAMALYPMMKDVLGRVNVEGAKMDGTPILTTLTMEGVKSAEEFAQEQKQNQQESKVDASGGVSGALGGFARRAMKKKIEGDPKPRATVMTSTTEILKLTTDVSASDVAVPAGFKETK
jgi:hypothetical protein